MQLELVRMKFYKCFSSQLSLLTEEGFFPVETYQGRLPKNIRIEGIRKEVKVESWAIEPSTLVLAA